MDELIKRLTTVPDCYSDFVLAITLYVKKKPERLTTLMHYLWDNTDATTSDVLEFVSDQPDFFEDSVHYQRQQVN